MALSAAKATPKDRNPVSRPATHMQLSGWSEAQTLTAAVSLLKYINGCQQGRRSLLEDEELLYLQVTLKRMPTQSRRDKPICIPLPYPIYTPKSTSLCLFIKDQLAADRQPQLHKRIEHLKKSGLVAKVITVSKLKTKYESFEAKRKLCNEYDLFLADDRVLSTLPKLIGKSFFKKKKQPVPVKLRGNDWQAEIHKACSSTHMYSPSGSCINVRIGLSSMSAGQIVGNVKAALPSLVQHIPKQWANVQALYLKSAESVALPVYQSLPDAPKKIKALL